MRSSGVPDVPDGAHVNQKEWELFFEKFGHARYRRGVRLLSGIPSAPRCEACGAPFGGAGGRLMRLVGKSPSRKNPRWCSLCFERSPEGGLTLTVGVLFIDVRGSTALAEEQRPIDVVGVLNRFYDAATKVIVRHGLVDKLIGDEVMGIYVPALAPGGRFVETMVSDARELLRALGYGADGGPFVDVGIGLDVGPAFLGHVGRGEVSDFTAIGDVVNTASRLQSVASEGQIIMTESMARRGGLDAGEGDRVDLELKGKKRLVATRVLSYR